MSPPARRPLPTPAPPSQAIDRRALCGGLLTGMGGLLIPFGRARAGNDPAMVPPAGTMLTFGYPVNMPPFSYSTLDGEVKGLAPDSVACVLDSLGWRHRDALLPWARVQSMLRAGTIDATLTTMTEERRNYLAFCSKPVLRFRLGVWHRATDSRFAKVRTVADLKGLRLGNYLGNSLVRETLPPGMAAGIAWAPSPELALRMVAAGHTEAMIQDGDFFSLVVHHEGLEGTLTFTPLQDVKTPLFTIAIRRNYPGVAEIIPALDHALVAQFDAVQALRRRYRDTPA